MPKAIAICGSPRKEGNTEHLLDLVLKTLSDHKIEGELERLAVLRIEPCTACGACRQKRDMSCAIKTDDFHSVFEKMRAADIVVVGSPVYFGSASPQLMALLDRAGYVGRANDNPFARKLGGAIAVARRAGQNFTFAQLVYWFLINDMIVPGSTYWNIAVGAGPGTVMDDAEGVQTVKRFAENLAWLADCTLGRAR